MNFCSKCGNKFEKENVFCSKCGFKLDVKNESILGLKTAKETSAKPSKIKANSVDEIQQQKEDNKTSKAKIILIFIKKYIYILLKIPLQILLIYITASISLVLTILVSDFFSISLTTTYIDSYGQPNLTFNGWLVFFISQLLFLYPYRKLKLIYAEFFSVISSSIMLSIPLLMLIGGTELKYDGDLIIVFLAITFFPILYFEKMHNSYKLKELLKSSMIFSFLSIETPEFLKKPLLKNKKKVFYASFLTLLFTGFNFTDEVIIRGQSLSSSPEELVGWIIGFFLGIGGLLFLKKNNYFKNK